MNVATLRATILRWLRPPRRLSVTREGKWFIAITIGIGFGAVNTGNNLLYLLLGWLLSVIIASGMLSESALRRLRTSRQVPARLYAGRPFLMGITLANQKRRLPSFSIEIEDLIGGKPLDKKCYFLKVPAGKSQATSYRHVFARRGLYRLEGFRVSTRFPFALFRKSRDVEAADEVLVYPAVHPVRGDTPRVEHGGDDARPRRGRRGEFFGLRELRPGDDPRDVHWRSSARQGRFMVREYEEEAHRRATVVLDNALAESATDAERAALEEAISLAASLASSYLGQGYAVRLLARGEHIPAATGPGQLHRILRALALLEGVRPETPFAARLEAARPGEAVAHVRPGAAPPPAEAP